ncbi:MAG: ribonuclease P protein component [Gammaproteobacteria bacterium]
MATAFGEPLLLDRSARLRRPADFRRVFARPQASRDAYFRVLATPNDLGQSRLGLAVSRRVSPRAVDRNRLKRIARESFRHHRGMLAQGGGMDIVVLPAPTAVTTSNPDLFVSLEHHWRRLIAKLPPVAKTRSAS